VAAERSGVAVRVHLAVVKVVVALEVCAKCRIILVGCQHKRSATAPAAHQLRGNQLLLPGSLTVLPQKIAECPHVLLQAAIGHIAAVAGETVGLRQAGGRAVLVGIAKNELACLDRRSRSGRRLDARSLDLRLREPVAEAEVVVGVVEWRGRLQIEIGEDLDTGSLCKECPVLADATVSFGISARRG
jgi:hypothetical protein